MMDSQQLVWRGAIAGAFCLLLAFVLSVPANSAAASVVPSTPEALDVSSTASCEDACVITGTSSVSDIAWDKTVYIGQGATLSISGTSTINGDVYVKGTLNTSGTVVVNGTLYCLHYGSMLSAGDFDYGYLNNSGSLKSTTMNVKSDWLSTEFPVITHKNTVVTKKDVKEATCTESGSYESTETCTACGEILSDTFVMTEPLGHDFVATGSGVKATCTVAGSSDFTCSRCGEKKTEAIPAFGHIAAPAVTENVVAATCEKAGSYQTVVKCATCGEVLSSKTVATEALGHEWGEWQTVKKATTSAAGLSERSCSRCGNVESKAIAKLKKSSQTIKVKTLAKTYKGKKLVKSQKLAKNQSFNLGATAKGKLSCKKTSGNAKVTVNASGKVTVKKGLKRGIYKVKVTLRAAGTSAYKAATKKVVVTIKVA